MRIGCVSKLCKASRGGVWLAALSLALGSTAQAAVPTVEREWLEALYHSTDGANWTNNTNWLTDDPCEDDWYGITCNADDTRVTQIDLAYNALAGSLPAGLNQLTALEIFNVNNNLLTGSIPSLTGLVQLRELRAFINQLTDSIPALTGLEELRVFDVGVNQLIGSIPSLAGLTQLDWFFVDRNQLTGSIPASVSDLDNLRGFWVSGNQLTGTIPAAPPNLYASQSNLCSPAAANGNTNYLSASADPAINAAWNAATGLADWSADCVEGYSVTPHVESSGGSIDPSTPQAAPAGEQVSITLLPDANYLPAHAGSCGGSISGTTYTTDPLVADCTVGFIFLAITTLADGTTGQPYAQQTAPAFVPPDDAVPPFSLHTGSLPPGLSLDPDTGEITGTPTQPGTYLFGVRGGGPLLAPPPAFSITITAAGAASVTPVPTLGHLGLLLMGGLLAAAGTTRLRRREG